MTPPAHVTADNGDTQTNLHNKLQETHTNITFVITETAQTTTIT